MLPKFRKPSESCFVTKKGTLLIRSVYHAVMHFLLLSVIDLVQLRCELVVQHKS